MSLEEPQQQPFLPRVRMIWLFVAITVVAISLGVIQSADQGQALAAAIVFTCIFLILFATLCGLSFLFAYTFGFIEKNLDQRAIPDSPFAEGRLPEQILPPNPSDTQ